jgi:hypothetical protein
MCPCVRAGVRVCFACMCICVRVCVCVRLLNCWFMVDLWLYVKCVYVPECVRACARVCSESMPVRTYRMCIDFVRPWKHQKRHKSITPMLYVNNHSGKMNVTDLCGRRGSLEWVQTTSIIQLGLLTAAYGSDRHNIRNQAKSNCISDTCPPVVAVEVHFYAWLVHANANRGCIWQISVRGLACTTH